MNSSLEQIQTTIANELNQKFTKIPVICQNRSDFNSCLQEKNLQFNGLCIFILSPIPKKAYKQIPKLTYQEVDIFIRIVEHSLLNKTEFNASFCAQEISTHLHHWQPKLDFYISPMSFIHHKPHQIHEYSQVIDLTFNISCAPQNNQNNEN